MDFKFPLNFDINSVINLPFTTCGNYTDGKGRYCVEGKIFKGIFPNEEPINEWGSKADLLTNSSKWVATLNRTFGIKYSDDFHDLIVDKHLSFKARKKEHDRIFLKLVQAFIDDGVLRLRSNSRIEGGEVAMTVADRVKTKRAAKGMTLAQVAAKAGTSSGFVHDIENGRRNPSKETLTKLRKALGRF